MQQGVKLNTNRAGHLVMAPQRDGAHAVAKPTDEQKKADAEQARLLQKAISGYATRALSCDPHEFVNSGEGPVLPIIIMSGTIQRQFPAATPPTQTAPSVLASALTAQKQTEGTATYTATPASAAAGATVLSWVGVRTALFAGPPAGNNGNVHTELFSQAYGNGFTDYSLRGYRCYSAAGGSNHSVTGSKSSATDEEATIAALVLSGGTVVSGGVVRRVANGAGATLTSGIATTTGPALLVASASGDGNVNATAPTQTWPTGDGWTVHRSVAFGSADAPNGHIPLYIATKEVAAAGDYTVGVQMTINEGATISLHAVQL